MTELNFDNLDRIIKGSLLDDKADVAIVQELSDLAAKDPTNVDALKARGTELGVIIVDTAMQMVAFNKERLESYRAEVVSMLSQLEDSFFETKGAGMSLMAMPFTKDGTQWGEQWMADMLFAIAKGLGLAWFTVEDRALWPKFPGGMPYITVKG